MEVLDIVRSAAFKAGVIPSFNPDELPEDVLNAGRAALTDEIMPTLNCDRTIDITVTSRVYKPVAGKIILYPLRQPIDNFEIIGYSGYTAALLRGPRVWASEVKRLRPQWVTVLPDDSIIRNNSTWPTNDLNEFRKLAIWSNDMQLVFADDIVYNGPTWQADIVPDVNIDFPPMRVDAVMDENSRYTYDYLYRDEYERTFKFTSLPGVYTTEEYDDKLVILLNGNPDAKLIVLPVPLQIVNRDYAHSGTIIAPEKFRRYLIDAVAVSLAIVYGMSTLPLMKEAAATSYNLLKKNKPQPLHKANVAQEITNKLRPDVLGRRFYANI
ncbi:MAG: hypothetical protein KIG84_05695 [Bacteroidales bacterium]|nr:hypothetical protein [Bacteroidales bacterium]